MPKLSDSIEFLQKIIASLFGDKVSQPWNKLFFSKIQKKIKMFPLLRKV